MAKAPNKEPAAETAAKLIKFSIFNRFSGAIQFTAEIEADDDAPISLKLGLAVKWAIKSGANLYGANLYGANLSGAKGAELAIACTRILPEGDIIGWKKLRNNIIAKLLIPADAKRSHAFGRKCRPEYADCLELFGGNVGVYQHDGKTEYRVGQRITPDSFDNNWQDECSNGIHWFITRVEAEAY